MYAIPRTLYATLHAHFTPCNFCPICRRDLREGEGLLVVDVLRGAANELTNEISFSPPRHGTLPRSRSSAHTQIWLHHDDDDDDDGAVVQSLLLLLPLRCVSRCLIQHALCMCARLFVSRGGGGGGGSCLLLFAWLYCSSTPYTALLLSVI